MKYPQKIVVPTGNMLDIRHRVNTEGPVWEQPTICDCCKFFTQRQRDEAWIPRCLAFGVYLEYYDMRDTAPNLKAKRCKECLDAEKVGEK